MVLAEGHLRSVEDGVLSCAQHDWKFDLQTGRCLTSDDVWLQVKPVEHDETATTQPTSPGPR